jgi:hypothetical protein
LRRVVALLRVDFEAVPRFLGDLRARLGAAAREVTFRRAGFLGVVRFVAAALRLAGEAVRFFFDAAPRGDSGAALRRASRRRRRSRTDLRVGTLGAT